MMDLDLIVSRFDNDMRGDHILPSEMRKWLNDHRASVIVRLQRITDTINRNMPQPPGWAEIYDCLRRNGFRPISINPTCSVPDCFYVR